MAIDISQARGVAGVYGIKNTVTGQIYIGRGLDIGRTRWPQHLSSLRHNTHFNYKLQKSWNAYGEIKFYFVILFIADKSAKNLSKLLDKKELEISRKYKKVFNLQLPGKTTFIPSPEIKKMISDRHRRPESVAKRRKKFKENLENPVFKKNWETAFFSDQSRAKQKASLNTPLAKKRRAEMFGRPDFVSQASKTSKARHKNLATKEKHKNAIRKAAKRPGAREKRSLAAKNNWLKPGYRQKRLASFAKKRAVRVSSI